jgi:hypothetical protein
MKGLAMIKNNKIVKIFQRLKSYIQYFLVSLIIIIVTFWGNHAFSQVPYFFSSGKIKLFIYPDTLKRFFVLTDQMQKSFTIWDVDSSSFSSFESPQSLRLMDNNMPSNIVPLSKTKIGVTTFNQKEDKIICNYSIYEFKEKHTQIVFTSSDEYTYSGLCSVDGVSCLLLKKKNSRFDIRRCNDYTILQHNQEYTNSNISGDDYNYRFLSNGKSFRFRQSHDIIEVWDNIRNRLINSFDGGGFLSGVEVDIHNAHGIFYSVTNGDLLNHKEMITGCVEIRSLDSGLRKTQLLLPSIEPEDGAVFSPVNSKLILIWSHKLQTAYLWDIEYNVIRLKILIPCGNKLKYCNYSLKDQNNHDNKSSTIVNEDESYKLYGAFSSNGQSVSFITENLCIYEFSIETGEIIKFYKLPMRFHDE